MNTTSQTSASEDNERPGTTRFTDERGPDTGCASSECIGESAPVETFALLANEDRLAILSATIQAHNRGNVPLSFSELRESVDIRDSGRFSYHLQELTGHLLTRSADGYSLHQNCCELLVEGIASIDE